MTKNNVQRDLIRAEMAATSVTYNVARRALEARDWELFIPKPAIAAPDSTALNKPGTVPSYFAATDTPDVTANPDELLDMTREVFSVSPPDTQVLYQQPNAVGTSHPEPDPNRLAGKIIAVVSGASGVGKTTIATLLAAALAQPNQNGTPRKRVCVVDLDLHVGAVAALLGQYVPTSLNIRVAPVWDAETVLENLVHDDQLGIDALLPPVRPRTVDDVSPEFYQHVIETLTRTHDVVVLDTTSTVDNPLTRLAFDMSTAALYVTTLSNVAVQSMARTLREVLEPDENGGMGIRRGKIGVVVNQSTVNVGMDKFQIKKVASALPIIGAIPIGNTQDLLMAANHNLMHLLLKHPTLGPAYLRLAQACVLALASTDTITGTSSLWSSSPEVDLKP